MTLPTSRQRPWIFPTQRSSYPTRDIGTYEKSVEAPSLVTGNVDGDESVHQRRQREAHERVLSAVKDNHAKDRYYLQNPNIPLKSREEIDPHLEVHPHPEHMIGGVFTSKAGQEYGRTRLKERVNEYNVRASAAFGTEATQAQPRMAVLGTPDTNAIDDAFTALLDSVQAVEFTQFIPNSKAILGKLYETGWTLQSNKIMDYADLTQTIKRNLISLINAPEFNIPKYRPGQPQPRQPAISAVHTAIDEGRIREPVAIEIYGVSQTKKRYIKTGISVIDRIARLLVGIARNVNLSPDERRLALKNERGRDLPEAAILSRGVGPESENINLPPNQIPTRPSGADVRPTTMAPRPAPPADMPVMPPPPPGTPPPDTAPPEEPPAPAGSGRRSKKSYGPARATEASRLLALMDSLADSKKKKV